VVEEPLTIELDDVTVTTTMRTPGHDFELAAGFYAKAPDVPDAHFNLARISRRRGDELTYRRHQQRYMDLTGQTDRPSQPEGDR